MSFRVIKCPDCGEPLQGLQLSEEQRVWLDRTKEAVLEHMRVLNEQIETDGREPSLDENGWFAIAEPFLFLYGYMISRENKKDS